jgi:hypothetical protein
MLRMVPLPYRHLHLRNGSEDLLPSDPSRVEPRIMEVDGVLQQFLTPPLEVDILIDHKGEEVVVEGDGLPHQPLFCGQYHSHVLPKLLVTPLSHDELREGRMNRRPHLVFYLHLCHLFRYKMYYVGDIRGVGES